ncbi:MAG: class I SAM-dependent methyltransferase [Pseudomonadota bacterium]
MSETLTRPDLTVDSPMGGGACPCCGSTALEDIFSVEKAPTNSCILLSTRDEAMAYPTGKIKLAFCDDCGFVFNRAFDIRLTEYSGRYEETQSFSGTFNKFHRHLAERLIEEYDLRNGRVLEIGCGKGEFLALLAELGDVKGVGVDPGVHPDRIDPALASRLEFIPAMFAPDHVQGEYDMVGCKMTLEHIPDPTEFVGTIREGVGDSHDCIIFFQVPEAMRILKTHAFEDVYYEHCAYFTAGSLARLFRRNRFDIVDIKFEYDDQYLTIEAKPAAEVTAPTMAIENDLDEVRTSVRSFAEGLRKTIATWRERLAKARKNNETVLIWGSGSKAVSFLTAVDVDRTVKYVTDINPNRHGHFMPSTGQEIISPERLGEIKPDLVIAMNRIYKDEIRSDLDKAGVTPELLAL